MQIFDAKTGSTWNPKTFLMTKKKLTQIKVGVIAYVALTDLGTLQRLSHSDVEDQTAAICPTGDDDISWSGNRHGAFSYSHKTILGGTFFEDFLFLFNGHFLKKSIED
jgi:hypothetical protein